MDPGDNAFVSISVDNSNSRLNPKQVTNVKGNGAFSEAWQDKKMSGGEVSHVAQNENGPGRCAAEGLADHFPALAWLSLARVLASRAPLRFTRQFHFNTHAAPPHEEIKM